MSVEEGTQRSSYDHRQSGLRTLADVLGHHAGTLLVAGGLMWVVTYLVEILIGVSLGEEVYADPDRSSSWLVWLWPTTFFASTFFLAAGLLGVATLVKARGRVLAAFGALLALVALTASAVNLVRLTGVVGEPTASDGLGFLGVVGVVGGSVLLGAATLRGEVMRRPARLTLTLLPLAFVPAIVATIPLEAVAPDYVVADLPFPVVGLVFAAVGYTLLRDRSSHPSD